MELHEYARVSEPAADGLIDCLRLIWSVEIPDRRAASRWAIRVITLANISGRGLCMALQRLSAKEILPHTRNFPARMAADLIIAAVHTGFSGQDIGDLRPLYRRLGTESV